MSFKNVVCVTLIGAIGGNVTVQTIYQLQATAPCGNADPSCMQTSRHHLPAPERPDENSTASSSSTYAWVNPFSGNIDPWMTRV